LTGVEKGFATTNALVRKVVGANPRVKAIILAPTQRLDDIVAALRAGACGFLCQNLPGDTLLRCVELVAHGEMIVHPQLAWSQTPSSDEFSVRDATDTAAYITTNGKLQLAQHLQTRSPHTCVNMQATNENQMTEVPALSRREMLILRMLMQGASNKVIARNLVITESTVKVHMKAILRKLRLQNRTQAAIWARNNVNEADWNNRDAASSAAH
jgi:two-component system nitrate/nitrite response regulator NarL